jgi:hypothetical protein
MILEPASLRLFTASDIRATEFETIAIKIFAAAKKKFVTMPINAVFIIIFSRLPSLKSIILRFLFIFSEIISLLDIKAKIL